MKTIKSLQQAEYQRRYKANVQHQRCDCGRPAARRTPGGFVCARCDALELAERFERVVDPRHRDPKANPDDWLDRPDKEQWSMSDSLVILCAPLTAGRGWGSLDLLEQQLTGGAQ
jgi:hypothetical protein